MPRLETVLTAAALGATLVLGAGYMQLRARLDAGPSPAPQAPGPMPSPPEARNPESAALAREIESLRLRVAELERLPAPTVAAPVAPPAAAFLEDPAVQARLRQILSAPAAPVPSVPSRPVGPFEGLGLDPGRQEALTRLMEESSQHLQSVIGRLRCGEWTRAQARAETQRHRIETDARVRTLLSEPEFARYAALVAPMRQQTDPWFDAPIHAPGKLSRTR